MAILNTAIMSDRSLLFACIEGVNTKQNIRSFLPDEVDRIRITKQYRRKKWLDFSFRNEKFSIYSDSGDLMLFADNNACPEEVLNELRKSVRIDNRKT